MKHSKQLRDFGSRFIGWERLSDTLRAGRSEVRTPVGDKRFIFLHTRLDRLWDPSSLLYNRYRGSFQGVNLPGHIVEYPPPLVPRLTMSGATPLLPLCASITGMRRWEADTKLYEKRWIKRVWKYVLGSVGFRTQSNNVILWRQHWTIHVATISFSRPTLFHRISLTLLSVKVLLWSFGPFSGIGLRLAGVSRQFNLDEVRMYTYAQPSNLDSKGIFVRRLARSLSGLGPTNSYIAAPPAHASCLSPG